MTPASRISSASKTPALSLKTRLFALLREMRESYERHSELQVMLASGYAQRLGEARTKQGAERSQ
jgi:hypothetical protein